MDVPLPIRIACNVVAKELVRFLYTIQLNGTKSGLEYMSAWYKEDKDLSAMLPDDWKMPKGLKGKIALSVIKKMNVRVGDRCPAYDLMLQYVYDAAGYAMMELVGMGDESGARKMREVQVIAAFLGNDKVRQWYYKNMDRLHARFLAKFEAGEQFGKEKIVG